MSGSGSSLDVPVAFCPQDATTHPNCSGPLCASCSICTSVRWERAALILMRSPIGPQVQHLHRCIGYREGRSQSLGASEGGGHWALTPSRGQRMTGMRMVRATGLSWSLLGTAGEPEEGAPS